MNDGGSMPKFIMVAPPLVVSGMMSKYPALGDVFTNKLTADTAIIVDSKVQSPYVNTREGLEQGILYTNLWDFEYVIKEMKTMLFNYQNGLSVKESASVFVSNLTLPTPGELHVKNKYSF